MARPTSDFDRMLAYRDRHAGWIVFRSVYWAIYLLLIGTVLLIASGSGVQLATQTFLGIALFILAIMIIVYGAAEVLHHKLMRRYG